MLQHCCACSSLAQVCQFGEGFAHNQILVSIPASMLQGLRIKQPGTANDCTCTCRSAWLMVSAVDCCRDRHNVGSSWQGMGRVWLSFIPVCCNLPCHSTAFSFRWLLVACLCCITCAAVPHVGLLQAAASASQSCGVSLCLNAAWALWLCSAVVEVMGLGIGCVVCVCVHLRVRTAVLCDYVVSSVTSM